MSMRETRDAYDEMIECLIAIETARMVALKQILERTMMVNEWDYSDRRIKDASDRVNDLKREIERQTMLVKDIREKARRRREQDRERKRREKERNAGSVGHRNER